MNNLEVPTNRVRRMALAAGALAVFSLVAAAGGAGAGTAMASTSSNSATGLEAAGSTGTGGGSGGPGGPPAAFRPSAFGMIATVSGDTLEVQNAQTGQTTVNLSSKTVCGRSVADPEFNGA